MKFNKIQIYVVFLMLINSLGLMAQPKIVEAKTSSIDSLEAILEVTTSDSTKVILWCEIAKVQSKVSLESAVANGEKALRNAKRLDNSYLIGQSQLTLGNLYFGYDKMTDALEYFEQVNTLADSSQNEILKELSTLALGDYYNRQQEYSKAINYYLVSKNISDKLKNDIVLGQTLNKIGTAYWKTKNNRKAFQFQRDALAVFEANKYGEGVTESYINIGRTFLTQGDFEEAMEYFEEALKEAKSLKVNKIIASTYYNIGQAKYEQKQYDKALEAYLNASDIAKINENPRLVASIYTAIGLTYLRQNNVTKGVEYERKSLGIFQSNNDLHGVAQSLNRLGSDYKNEVGTKQAITYLKEALKINTILGVSLQQGQNHLNLAYVYVQESKFNDALVETKKSLAIAENLNDKPLLKDVNYLLSQVYAAKKQYKEAYISHQNYQNLSDTLEEEQRNFNMSDAERYQNRMSTRRGESQRQIRNLRFWAILASIVALLLISVNVYFYKSLNYARSEVAERDRLLEQKQADYDGIKAILKKVVGEEKK